LQIRNEFLKRKLWAFEIKLTTSPGKRDLDRLKKTAAMIGADRSVLVSKSNRTIQGQDAVITGIKGVLKLMAALQ
jgi:hypothetical protein